MNKKFHFIGIKGAGMSALAQVLHDMGYEVQGSDRTDHFFTEMPLLQRKIKIFPFSVQNIDDLSQDTIVVASNAYQADHEEVRAVYQKGLSFLRYNEMVSQLVAKYTSIGIAGTHGKTTTTGLLSHVFHSIPMSPSSYIIGDGTGKGIPNSQYFLYESCEYQRTFLAYHPDYCIVTNIDFDHPDYFSGIQDVKQAFQQMIQQVKKYLVICGDDPNIRSICTDEGTVLWFGVS